MIAPVCNHSTQEAETGKLIHVEPSLDDTDHPGLTSTTQWDPILEVKEGEGGQVTDWKKTGETFMLPKGAYQIYKEIQWMECHIRNYVKSVKV